MLSRRNVAQWFLRKAGFIWRNFRWHHINVTRISYRLAGVGFGCGEVDVGRATVFWNSSCRNVLCFRYKSRIRKLELVSIPRRIRTTCDLGPKSKMHPVWNSDDMKFISLIFDKKIIQLNNYKVKCDLSIISILFNNTFDFKLSILNNFRSMDKFFGCMEQSESFTTSESPIISLKPVLGRSHQNPQNIPISRWIGIAKSWKYLSRVEAGVIYWNIFPSALLIVGVGSSRSHGSWVCPLTE